MEAVTLLLGLVLVVVGWLLLKKMSSKKLRLPPQPEGGLPLLGHLMIFLRRPEVESNEESVFVKFARQLAGNIYMLNLAGTYAYILTCPKLVRTAFSNPDTKGRPANKSHKRAFGPRAHGITLSQGENWRVIHKFVSDLFRRLGVGRARFEEVISSEVERLAADLSDLAGPDHVTDIQFRIKKAITNIVSGIMFGKQFEYNDVRFEKMIQIVETYLSLTGPSGPDSLALMFPFGRGAQLRKCMAEFKAYCEESIADHQGSTSDFGRDDFVGAFLAEMESEAVNEEVFNHENMMACCLDMFVAGVDTVSSSITFAILLLVSYPEVQEKLREEIDMVIGRDKPATLAEKGRLPFLQAVVSETWRIANVAPFGAPHMATKDLELFGFDVPKGTMFMALYAGIYNNAEKYPDPERFDPERFLEDRVYRKDEDFAPFGTGLRFCPGENLARSELFLFLSNLIQRFKFSVPKGSKKPEVYLARIGGTRIPLPYDVLVERRS